MMNKIFGVIARRAVFQSTRLFYCGHYQVKCYYHFSHDAPKNTCVQSDSNLFLIKRFKHKKKSSEKKMQEEDLDEDDDDDDEEEFETDESKSRSVIVTTKVNSLRLDTVAKAGFAIARKKIEDAFFESKIRLNGQKVLKLSKEVNVDDEIDYIRGRSDDNPNFLIVTRATILSIEPISGGIRLKLSRDKSLLIEEYSVPWKS